MFFRAKRAIGRAWFNVNCRGVLRTAPLASMSPEITLVSMVCHGEILMYVLAAKSFSQHLGREVTVVVLNDGSLTNEDQLTIRSHLPSARIVHISEVSNKECPVGSCWERLLLISDLVENSYVVQLDSDTLTMRPIPEVIACIDANRSFTLLGDRSYPEIEPMLEACVRSKQNLDPQVQAVCERSFDQLPEAKSLKYLRGNAGFTGFAKGSIGRDRIQWFSELMRGLAGEKWDTWGSEQVTSNLLISNAEGAYALDFPKYLSYWAHDNVPYEQASFVHFIGPFRFANGFYVKSAKKAIAALPRG